MSDRVTLHGVVAERSFVRGEFPQITVDLPGVKDLPDVGESVEVVASVRRRPQPGDRVRTDLFGRTATGVVVAADSPAARHVDAPEGAVVFVAEGSGRIVTVTPASAVEVIS